MLLLIAIARAAIAQLGERQTEDLKVPGSIPGLGISLYVPSARPELSVPIARPYISRSARFQLDP